MVAAERVKRERKAMGAKMDAFGPPIFSPNNIMDETIPIYAMAARALMIGFLVMM